MESVKFKWSVSRVL